MIFLTGGSGLLGRHILEELQSRHQPVLALARSPAAQGRLAGQGARIHQGDAAEPDTWRRLDGVRAIVHSAAIIASRAGWPAYLRANVTATRLAALRARELGIPLIHLSSIAVYGAGAGTAPPGSVTEDYPRGSRERGPLYARSKRLAEDVVTEEEARGLRAVVLRPCVVYGEGDRLFLPNVLRLARHGIFPLVGSGDLPLAIVHARNVAGAVAAAIDNAGAHGRTFNLTSDGDLTGTEFVAGLAAGLGRPVRPIRVPAALAFTAAGAADLLRLALGRTSPGFRSAARFLGGGNPYSSVQARATLGWSPRVSHREALPRAVRHLLEIQ